MVAPTPEDDKRKIARAQAISGEIIQDWAKSALLQQQRDRDDEEVRMNASYKDSLEDMKDKIRNDFNISGGDNLQSLYKDLERLYQLQAEQETPDSSRMMRNRVADFKSRNPLESRTDIVCFNDGIDALVRDTRTAIKETQSRLHKAEVDRLNSFFPDAKRMSKDELLDYKSNVKLDAKTEQVICYSHEAPSKEVSDKLMQKAEATGAKVQFVTVEKGLWQRFKEALGASSAKNEVTTSTTKDSKMIVVSGSRDKIEEMQRQVGDLIHEKATEKMTSVPNKT